MRAAVCRAAVLWIAGIASAQPALIRDIEPGAGGVAGADPYGIVKMDGVLYYGAWDLEHGFELWRSDGSAAGTHIVADVQPGPVGSLPRQLTVVGSTLFFVANDGTSGFALWSTDGTGAGTRLLRAVGADPDDPTEQMSFPRQLTALGTRLLFTARGSLNEVTLWSSDGTPEGTHAVLALGDIVSLADYRQARPMAVVGNEAWLVTRRFGHRALFRTDGTAGGTTLVWTETGYPPACCGGTDVAAAFGALVVFRGSDASGREALWRSDGTPGGTFVLASSASGLSTGEFTQVGATLYFAAAEGSVSPPQTFTALWRSDGTPGGTSQVVSFAPARIGQLTGAAGRVFFVVEIQTFGNQELGVSDGTPAGTRIFPMSLGRTFVAGAGDHATFVGNAGTVGVSDGTTAGTVILREGLFVTGGAVWGDLELAPLGTHPALKCLEGECFFRARQWTDRNSPAGQRRFALWRTDGTADGTRPASSRPRPGRGSWPEQFTGNGASHYFSTSLAMERAPNGEGVVHLMKTDGTAQGTTPVMSWAYYPGECDVWGTQGEQCRLWGLAPVGQHVLFFRTSSSTTLAELWSSDLTPAGTQRLRWDFTVDTVRNGMGTVGGRLVFSDQDWIWASDGTAAGTVPVAELVGPITDNLQFTLVGGKLFFAAPAGLHTTTGTPGSVQLVKAVPAAELTGVAEVLFFSSNGELWKSDGTAAGTVRVAATQHASRLTAAGARVFFTAWDAAHGTELWVSDGTAAGTERVADLRAGYESSEPDALTAEGQRLFFTADNGVWGRELWVSDGTREGTWPVADIHPGTASSLGEGPILVAGGGRVFFPAFTPATGVELWSSDGTEQGTALVQDIAPGAPSANPRELAVVGDRLYFSADDGLRGQEPWSLPLGPSIAAERVD